MARQFNILNATIPSPDNIEKVDNCFTRLRLIVKDSSLVKDEVLKQMPLQSFLYTQPLYEVSFPFHYLHAQVDLLISTPCKR